MHPADRRPSTRTTFTLLMGAALVLAFLPSSCTHRLRSVGQPLAIFLGPLGGGARHVAEQISQPNAKDVSPEELERLQRENAELQRQLGHAHTRLAEMERDLANVSGLRRLVGGGNVTIKIVGVIAPVADPHRDALRISAGRGSGLQVGQWVAAGDVWRDGADMRNEFEKQWLIGRISEVREFESTVTLLSDMAAPPELVKLARPREDGGWEEAGDALLQGVGRGRMEIRDATRDFFQEGAVIVLAQRSASLPASMTVGRATGSKASDLTQLHFNLTVAPWGAARRLDHVYVVAVEAPGR